MRIKVGITVGDTNGIGIETILKTFRDNRMLDFCVPVIFGSNKIISKHKKKLTLQDINFNIINSIKKISSKKINILSALDEDISVDFGEESIASGEYALKSINSSIIALKNKEIDVLVTAPINKSSIQKKEKDFIGHTEYLEKNFDGKSLMIMVSENMKIACLTGHVSLINVNNAISKSKLIETIKIFHNTLKVDFGIISPKIAVLGLNPHAGENGMLGNEEIEIISPAINELKKENLLIFGPYSADSFFTNKNLSVFDGILSMYHDQGLIPFKTLSFTNGVNYTAGLNIIRTSPVHGTAYEIAGQGEANEQSFRESIFLACEIYKKRMQYGEFFPNKENKV